MRYSKFYVILILALGLISFSCSDLQQDITPPSKVSVHGTDVINPSSATYHGLSVKEKTLESCRQCHAFDYSGGIAQVNCVTCHPALIMHQNDINNPSASGFHGKYIASKNWSMASCILCHGSNYSGGLASPSCITCHKNTGGPEACNTCHGSFSNPALIAPPTDLSRNIDPKFAGVGAHSNHLMSPKTGAKTLCNDCHIVPASYSSAGHIDNTPHAELFFQKKNVYEIGNASYDYATNKCSNTYCHGGFSFSKANSQYPFAYDAESITGNNYQPVWTKVDGSQIECGSCHGLPPAGHMDSSLESCATCHIGVVDKYGKIIDATKHMNRKINVFNLEY